MKLTHLLLTFGTFSLAVATAASSFHVDITRNTLLGSTELKPDTYIIQVDGDKAVVKSRKTGKAVTETPVKVETVKEKYDSTTLGTQTVDGKSKLTEIRIGGTKTRLVFEASVPAGQ